ncbi:MAG: cyclopropane-fatty-acyl-phospholipid synthase family protein [Rhodospirillales bacterium]|jgi:cyclopropane-fatty-acyl-phospholipid synthase|nr:SAM-dependent methyltransferase [Rhodospirillaceae bacterium]MDP6573531.1 cyclopropane-fatty-acyl-phospholipid synthase family protein [Rhodospirillales bacterium]
MLVAKYLDKIIRVGTLTVVDAHGKTHRFEGTEGPAVTVRLHDKALHWKLFFDPQLYAGEAFTDGNLTIVGGSIYDFLELVSMNMASVETPLVQRMALWGYKMARRLHQYNPARRARKNAAHHYDLSGQLYDLFLDADKQYSCAYFAGGNDDLDTAQADKMRHIAAKLLLEPGHKVLDIGSGWGGLAIYLAREMGVDVTGLTLSEEQLKVAEASAREAGLEDRVRFKLRDYREETGSYDRIVSVGMFEHVGVNHFGTYFAKVRELLTDDGVMLLHTIGYMDGPSATDPWIRKYIFPGGYIPALSEIAASMEKTALWTTDIEVLRLHYADTMRHWRRRFLARRADAEALYDERFCRMWEYYLACSEIGFRHLGNVVFQIQLAKRQEAVPLTRDYIARAWDGAKRSGRPSDREAA